MKKGIVLLPDELVWDVRYLDALIQLWIDDCHTRLPAKTVDGYADKIEHFRCWLAENGPELGWELRKRDIQTFAVSLETAGLAFNTRKDVLRRLRACLRWAAETGRTEGVDYRSWVPKARGSVPVRVAAPILDLIKLMEAAGRGRYPARDRAILAVQLGAGLRRAEAAALNIEDVQLYADGSGTIIVREAKVVEGRDRQWRVVAVDAPTGRHLRTWLDACGRTSGPLFPSMRGGKRLTPQGIYKAVKALIDLAGLGDKLQGPHDLRRNFATYYSRQRRGEGHGQALSRQLGHASYRMTSQYNLQDAEDLRETMISPFALMENYEQPNQVK